MTEHPTPWRDRNGGPLTLAGVSDANGATVFHCDDTETRDRIIAAVNACAGIPTEELESLDHGELTTEHLTFGAIAGVLADARQERAALLLETQQAKGDTPA